MILRFIAALTLVLGACCPSGGPVDEIFLIRSADTALQPLIDACRDPGRRDCLPLCARLIGNQYTTIEHCEMHADRDGYQQVHVGYGKVAFCE